MVRIVFLVDHLDLIEICLGASFSFTFPLLPFYCVNYLVIEGSTLQISVDYLILLFLLGFEGVFFCLLVCL